MRAVEGSLRRLVVALLGDHEFRPLLWKAVIDRLAEHPTPPPATPLAHFGSDPGELPQPDPHSDVVYDTGEAQDLAVRSIDVLARLLRATPIVILP
jgi:hypothetical protein